MRKQVLELSNAILNEGAAVFDQGILQTQVLLRGRSEGHRDEG